MIENFLCEILNMLVGHVRTQPVGIETHLIHSNQSYGREMIIKCTKVSACIRVKTLIEQLRYYSPLYLERTSCYIHHLVKALVEVGLVS